MELSSCVGGIGSRGAIPGSSSPVASHTERHASVSLRKAPPTMTHPIVLTLALGANAALASGVIAAPARSAPFDGTWQVRLVTSAGSCAPSYSYTLTIAGGQVRSLGGSGASPVNVSGGVGRDGSVTLAVQHSLAQADASGRLQRSVGEGMWSVAGLGCIGRWTAQRSSARAEVE